MNDQKLMNSLEVLCEHHVLYAISDKRPCLGIWRRNLTKGSIPDGSWI